MQRRQFIHQFLALIATGFVPTHALAEARDEREILFSALKAAKSEKEGRRIEHEIWQWWLAKAPTPDIRKLIDHGMSRRSSYDFEGAERTFDQVIQQAPGFAEGWNQRAFARFLRDNNDGALSDLEKTLELEPDHFGALSGMYHVLMRMGRPKPALASLARAVAIHPWIQERSLLPKDPDAKRPLIKGKQQEL